MSPGTKTCIAYLAARLVSGSAALRIFDVQRSLWVRIGGTIRGGSVRLYDYDRKGVIHGDLPDVTDFCTGISFQLHVNGARFRVDDAMRSHELHGLVVGVDVEIRNALGAVDRYRLEPIG